MGKLGIETKVKVKVLLVCSCGVYQNPTLFLWALLLLLHVNNHSFS